MKADMKADKTAHIRLLNATSPRPVLEVAVPRGTSVKDSLRVIDKLDSVIEKLTGCPCISGLDLQLRDRVIIEANVHVKKRIDSDFEQDIDLHA